MTRKQITLALVFAAGAVMATEPPDACSIEPDNQRRLACYDRAFPPVPPSTDAVAAQPAASHSGQTSSAMAAFWELGPDDKRRPFVVRTYQPNFLLPIHYTSSVNRSTNSPTQAAGVGNAGYRPIEAKLQVSLRAKVAENLLLPGADLWLAYTQRSLWQVWDTSDSQPFRSTDYQPEAIYIIPVPERIGELPAGWKLRMLQLGFTHQSNGQSDPLSRGWNRLGLGAGLERGDFSLLLRANQRLRLQGKDDNPDIADYLGRGEIDLAWLPGTSTLSLAWRGNLQSGKRGSLQLDWTHPVFADQPTGLRWYAQLFHGYGETLLDYKHRQTSLGLGLTLFQF